MKELFKEHKFEFMVVFAVFAFVIAIVLCCLIFSNLNLGVEAEYIGNNVCGGKLELDTRLRTEKTVYDADEDITLTVKLGLFDSKQRAESAQALSLFVWGEETFDFAFYDAEVMRLPDECVENGHCIYGEYDICEQEYFRLSLPHPSVDLERLVLGKPDMFNNYSRFDLRGELTVTLTVSPDAPVESSGKVYLYISTDQSKNAKARIYFCKIGDKIAFSADSVKHARSLLEQ